jgi:UDP-N-acetylmuramate--alanine ligase
MHIFFSGIGGTAIGPLALIAKQAGYEVSGSDKQDSQYVEYLKKHGIIDIHIGQTHEAIAAAHDKNPIDWYVYSSAVEKEDPNHPELAFVDEQDIKKSKRDELTNLILQDKKLKLIAIAGTHGKSTTTAMTIWMFKELGIPVSYSVGAKISFGDMGSYEKGSEFFVYECDEFDRNFLAFEPFISIISGVTWDHHEIFPTREDYQEAFKEFISQSEHTILWEEDAQYLSLQPNDSLSIQDSRSIELTKPEIDLPGVFTRLDAWLVVKTMERITNKPIDELVEVINRFPGLQRRMEEIIPNLFSDYAHTPEKIRGGLSVALELAEKYGQRVVVVYEPLTNRRQHYMIDDYKDCFAGAAKVYWIPSYLAREEPNQRVIPPAEMISHLADPTIAEPLERDENLKKVIEKHLAAGDLVVGMAGGGGDSLDEWLRTEFKK